MRAATVILLALTIATPALAGPWSSPAVLQAGTAGDCTTSGSVPEECFFPADTRAAINARGETVVVWADVHFVVRAAFARRDGSFGRPQRLGKGLRPAVVVRSDGSAVAAWYTGHAIRFARAAHAGRFGPAQRLAPTNGMDDDVSLFARPDGGVVAVYDARTSGTGDKVSTERVRSVDIPRAGAPSPPVTLGPGTVSLAAGSPNGGIAAYGFKIGLRTRAPDTDAWTNGGDTGGLSVESVAATNDGPLLGVVDAGSGRGNGGYHGRPGALRGAWGAPFGEPQFGAVVHPSRTFGPIAAAGGDGRTIVVYHENAEADYAYGHGGTLYLVSAPAGAPFGKRVRLDADKVYQPFVAPRPDGALLAWSFDQRWRVAWLEGGVVHRVAAPGGGPGGFFEVERTDQTLAAAGSYAALAWKDSQGAVRASVARIG